jgi:hypothetical protein
MAANYSPNNDNIALSFDDANSTVVVKDTSQPSADAAGAVLSDAAG